MQGDIWVVGHLLLHQEESLSQFVNNDFTHTHAMIMRLQKIINLSTALPCSVLRGSATSVMATLPIILSLQSAIALKDIFACAGTHSQYYILS